MEEEEGKNKIRESLKEFLEKDNTLPVESSTNSDLPTRLEIIPMDYSATKTSASAAGKKLMNSLLKLYLSEEIIEKNEYIKLKAKVDEMTLSSLIFQMQAAEHALVTLMRTIDSGELHPRMFEVLGGLQKTMLDIMKHQTLHLHAMEEGAKKLKHDIDIYTKDELPSSTEKNSNQQNINRGTRNVMRNLQSEIQDVEFNEESDE